MKEIVIEIKPHYHGKYRIEYDGKYITLFGEDKNYPMQSYGTESETFFDEMVLVPVVHEGRNLTPSIKTVTEKHIIVTLTTPSV